MSVPVLARRAVRHTLGALADLAFPTTCLGCTLRLRHDPASPPLCPTCRRAVPPAERATLTHRFAKLPYTPPFAHLAALWTYDEHGTVARIQHRLKYGNRPHLGIALGRWLADALPSTTSSDRAPFDLVVPIPLHRRRRLARGYNQSACLARGLAATHDLDCAPDLLIRARHTRSQTKLGHAERWTNVDGAFAVARPQALRDCHILLIDDVLTTGATLAAAARPLVEAGATVSVAALACTREYA